jgi:tetratricopeptide (TPR) repeat protein
MSMMKTIIFLLAMLVSTWTTDARAQSVEPVPVRPSSPDFWRDPVFINKFLGTYGFLSGVEPKVTPEELKTLRAVLDQLRENPAGAAAELKKAITGESSAALDYILGNLSVQTGQYDDALKHYRKALEKFPDFLRAHKNLAFVMVQKGHTDEAVKHFQRALELGGEDGNVYGLLGYCYLQQDKLLSAETAYRKAMMFAPENLDWKLGIARCLLAQQRSREAVALFEELIQKDPEKADNWFFQANAFIELGEPQRAAHNFEIVRRMDKATPASLMALGDIYMMQDAKEQALTAYRESLDKDPKQDVKRPMRCVEVLISRQGWTQATAMIEKIRGIYKESLGEPDRLKLWRCEAQVALATGDSKQAAETLAKIIEKDPMDGEAILLLAGYNGRSGDVERAELLYERAATIKTVEVNALIQHAQFLVAQSKYEKAAKLLRRAQELRPREAVAKYLDQVDRLARASR